MSSSNTTNPTIEQALNDYRPGETHALVEFKNGKPFLCGTDRLVVPKQDQQRYLQGLEKKHPSISQARFLVLVKQLTANISKRDVQRFKMQSQTYARSQVINKPFRGAVRSVFSQFTECGMCLAFDLIDNTGQPAQGQYVYILTCADIFSRYCWLAPLTTKASQVKPGLSLQQMLSRPTVLRTMKRIFDEHRFSYTLSDNGTEFEAEVTRFLAQRGVPRAKQLKAKTYSGGVRMVESLNGQVRRMIARRRAQHTGGGFSWVTAAKDVQDELNNTPHSVTKVAPAKVWRTRNGQDADLHQFVRMRNMQAAEKTVETSTERLGKPLRVNDRVRIALVAISSRARKERKQAGGKKSEMPSWTRALYTILSVSQGTRTSQRRYMLSGMGRKHFYKHELQRQFGTVRKDEAPPGPFAQELQPLGRQFEDEMMVGAKVPLVERRFLGATVSDGRKRGRVIGFFDAENEVEDDDYEPPYWVAEVDGRKYLLEAEDMVEYLSSEQPDKQEQARLADEAATSIEAERKRKAAQQKLQADVAAKQAVSDASAAQPPKPAAPRPDAYVGNTISFTFAADFDQLVKPSGQPQRVTGKVVRYDKKKRGRKHYWVEWDKAKLRSAPQSMSVDEIRRLRTV
jgi:hypothetical protein